MARLRDWLHEDVEGRRLHRRLHAAARSWESAGRDTSELYRGTRLEAATDWATSHQDEATSTERTFLDASVEYAASESRALAEHARRDTRQKRRLGSLLGALAIALVLALLVGVVAVGQRSRADRQRELAQREGRVATARELAAAAYANVVVDPERSILLALEAVERSGSAGDPTRPRRRRPSTAPWRRSASSSTCRTSVDASTGVPTAGSS